MSDPVSAPRRASTFAPKLGMTWATATRPGEEYLAGHVVMLLAYREMLRYWKGVVQARNAHGVGVGDGASSCRHAYAQRSARRLRSDPVVPLPLVLSSCGARCEGCSRPCGRVATGNRAARRHGHGFRHSRPFRVRQDYRCHARRVFTALNQ
jgi:hypothetical protein